MIDDMKGERYYGESAIWSRVWVVYLLFGPEDMGR